MLRAGSVVAERFEIEGELGRGGTATVFLARDRQMMGERVALKVLHPHLGNDDALRARLGREILACRSLSHPNILPVYELHNSGGYVFLSMAYHRGRNLSERLAESGPMSIEEVRALGLALSSALQEAHLKGILHRDIKPQNVLISDDGAPQLVDFGLARIEQLGTLVGKEGVVGTAGYVPPEVLMGEGWEPRGDLYGLGVLLFQALTGVMPFEGRSPMAILRAQGEGVVKPPSAYRPEVPRWLEGTILNCLQPTPQLRPSGASAVYDALREGPSGVSLEVVSLPSRGGEVTEGARGELSEGHEPEGHVLFLKGFEWRVDKATRGTDLERHEIDVIVRVLRAQGYVVPQGFSGKLRVQWSEKRDYLPALIGGLSLEEARSLQEALEEGGVLTRLDGHRLGPIFKSAKVSSTLVREFLLFGLISAFLPLEPIAFWFPMFGVAWFAIHWLFRLRLKGPKPLLRPPHESMQALTQGPTQARPTLDTPPSLTERIKARGRRNQERGVKVLASLGSGDILPTQAREDCRSGVEETLACSEGLEKRGFELARSFEELEGGASDATLRELELAVDRHMAQLMTLGASLDSMALFLTQARLAKDVDLLGGVSRVVSRLEGDVASAARVLEEDGLKGA